MLTSAIKKLYDADVACGEERVRAPIDYNADHKDYKLRPHREHLSQYSS
jgi:hypothetical protein